MPRDTSDETTIEKAVDPIKSLLGQMGNPTKALNQLNKKLEGLKEGTPEYQTTLEEKIKVEAKLQTIRDQIEAIKKTKIEHEAEAVKKEYQKKQFWLKDPSAPVYYDASGNIISEPEYRALQLAGTLKKDEYFDINGKKTALPSHYIAPSHQSVEAKEPIYYDQSGKLITEKDYIALKLAKELKKGEFYTSTGEKTKLLPHEIKRAYYDQFGKEISEKDHLSLIFSGSLKPDEYYTAKGEKHVLPTIRPVSASQAKKTSPTEEEFLFDAYKNNPTDTAANALMNYSSHNNTTNSTTYPAAPTSIFDKIKSRVHWKGALLGGLAIGATTLTSTGFKLMCTTALSPIGFWALPVAGFLWGASYNIVKTIHNNRDRDLTFAQNYFRGAAFKKAWNEGLFSDKDVGLNAFKAGTVGAVAASIIPVGGTLLGAFSDSCPQFITDGAAKLANIFPGFALPGFAADWFDGFGGDDADKLLPPDVDAPAGGPDDVGAPADGPDDASAPAAGGAADDTDADTPPATDLTTDATTTMDSAKVVDASILLNGDAADDMGLIQDFIDSAKEVGGVNSDLIDAVQEKMAGADFVMTADSVKIVTDYAESLNTSLTDGSLTVDEYRSALAKTFENLANPDTNFVKDIAGQIDDIEAYAHSAKTAGLQGMGKVATALGL